MKTITLIACICMSSLLFAGQIADQYEQAGSLDNFMEVRKQELTVAMEAEKEKGNFDEINTSGDPRLVDLFWVTAFYLMRVEEHKEDLLYRGMSLKDYKTLTLFGKEGPLFFERYIPSKLLQGRMMTLDLLVSPSNKTQKDVRKIEMLVSQGAFERTFEYASHVLTSLSHRGRIILLDAIEKQYLSDFRSLIPIPSDGKAKIEELSNHLIQLQNNDYKKDEKYHFFIEDQVQALHQNIEIGQQYYLALQETLHGGKDEN